MRFGRFGNIVSGLESPKFFHAETEHQDKTISVETLIMPKCVFQVKIIKKLADFGATWQETFEP